MTSAAIERVRAHVGMPADEDGFVLTEEDTDRGAFVTVRPPPSDDDGRASLPRELARSFRSARYFVEHSTGDLYEVPSSFLIAGEFIDALEDATTRDALRVSAGAVRGDREA